MATLAPSSPSISPPFHRRRKSWARRIERACCQTFSYFPLCFVYGLTSWAVWVEVSVSLLESRTSWVGYLKAGLGILLYGLAVVCYTFAVFTDPGSPLDVRRDDSLGRSRRRKGGDYEGLPSHEDEDTLVVVPEGMSTVTAKSSGQQRYCKKCQAVKPDRSHHCSTCGKCVLKMDHHCPWLATCAGLRNYKPFLLFLTYTSLFCWVCFGVSATWVWAELMDQVQMEEGFRVANTILLSVLGGIIGLVLSGFTGWHIYLVVSGQTTIESLEKTRYLSPLRKNMEQQFQHQAQRHYLGEEEDQSRNVDSSDRHSSSPTLTEHLKTMHANALPGVLRPEEGDTPLHSRTTTPLPQTPPWRPSWQQQQESDDSSPAQQHLRTSYANLEAQREHDRYSAYLDEQDSEKLPNAFDLGWKRNALQVFGLEPWYWLLPVRNSMGDGWRWEVSPDWIRARDQVAEQRARATGRTAAPAPSDRRGRGMRWESGRGFVDPSRPLPGSMDSGRQGSGVQMLPLDRRKMGESPDPYDSSSDEDSSQRRVDSIAARAPGSNWNDVPEEYLVPRRVEGTARSISRGRRKGD